MNTIYFLGIGGIGMSALARYFKANSYEVGGYDRTVSALTQQLQNEGIEVNYEDQDSCIPEKYRSSQTLIVYTPAIPQDCNQRLWFENNGFKLHKRAEILGLLSKKGKALCVAGTHGKTTTTTMLSFILKQSKIGCSAFLGGISMNYGTNLLIDTNSDYIVVEADEFDRSFLHLEPQIAAITAMDADHLDIYGTKECMIEAFEEFATKTRNDGKIFLKYGLNLKQSKVYATYGLDSKADIYSDNLRLEGSKFKFDYHGLKCNINDIVLGIPGRVHVENATLAISIALEVGVTPDEIKHSLKDFKGVVRRMNIHFDDGKRMYIDDYAHHPREIEATLKSIRELWPNKVLTVVFQPHLFTRTRDLHSDFAKSLSLADHVYMLDIYPAREKPIEGVTSDIISDDITCKVDKLTKDNLLVHIAKNFHDGILVTMGAGDIDRFIPLITNELSK